MPKINFWEKWNVFNARLFTTYQFTNGRFDCATLEEGDYQIMIKPCVCPVRTIKTPLLKKKLNHWGFKPLHKSALRKGPVYQGRRKLAKGHLPPHVSQSEERKAVRLSLMASLYFLCPLNIFKHPLAMWIVLIHHWKDVSISF